MNVDDISTIVGAPLHHLVYNKSEDPSGAKLRAEFDKFFNKTTNFMLPILINVETDDLGMQTKMGHWCGALRDGSAMIWFDPSGKLPVQVLGRRFTHYMNQHLQAPNTLTCGIWVGLFFAYRGIGEDRFAKMFKGLKDKDLFVERLYAYRLVSSGITPRKGIVKMLKDSHNKVAERNRKPKSKRALEFTVQELADPAVQDEILAIMAEQDRNELPVSTIEELYDEPIVIQVGPVSEESKPIAKQRRKRRTKEEIARDEAIKQANKEAKLAQKQAILAEKQAKKEARMAKKEMQAKPKREARMPDKPKKAPKKKLGEEEALRRAKDSFEEAMERERMAEEARAERKRAKALANRVIEEVVKEESEEDDDNEPFDHEAFMAALRLKQEQTAARLAATNLSGLEGLGGRRVVRRRR